MKRVVTPRSPSQLRTALAMNSGPLSDRMCSGTTVLQEELREQVEHVVARHPSRATRMAKHSRVYSSITVSRRSFLPSWVRLAYEVIGPDVVSVLRPQTDAGTIGQPQPASLGLFGRHLEALRPARCAAPSWRSPASRPSAEDR